MQILTIINQSYLTTTLKSLAQDANNLFQNILNQIYVRKLLKLQNVGAYMQWNFIALQEIHFYPFLN